MSTPKLGPIPADCPWADGDRALVHIFRTDDSRKHGVPDSRMTCTIHVRQLPYVKRLGDRCEIVIAGWEFHFPEHHGRYHDDAWNFAGVHYLDQGDGVLLHIYPADTVEGQSEKTTPEMALHRSRKINPMPLRSLEDRWQLAERDGGMRCAYCGHEDLPHRLTMDHVIPRSQGGVNGLANRVLSCPACDLEKAGRTPQQWRPGWQSGNPVIDRATIRRDAPRTPREAEPRLTHTPFQGLTGLITEED